MIEMGEKEVQRRHFPAEINHNCFSLCNYVLSILDRDFCLG